MSLPAISLDQFLTLLGPVTQVGANWQAKCPAHEDARASLSIALGRRNDIILKCFAGCSFEAILAPLHLSPQQLFAPVPSRDPFKKILTATYDYRDAAGALVFQVCRFEPKDFRQRRPNPALIGQWIWDMKGIARIPYRLNELHGHQTVYVAEGEKDVDALWALGVPATTNAGGAGKWKVGDSAALKAAGVTRVVLLPDNDKPGRTHMDAVATSVKAVGIAVVLLALPQVALKGDVSDWLAAGGTGEQLQALVSKQPWIVPKGGTVTAAESLADPFPYNTTDLGAAEGFRDRYLDRVRYDHKESAWLLWDGQHWQRDATEAVMGLANNYARTLYREADGIQDSNKKKTVADFAIKLERRGPRENMLVFLRTLPTISVDGRDTWDQDPWLLGCPNGVVDLRTGLLRVGVPSDMMTRQTAIAYDPLALCPRWWTFLSEVFDGNVVLVDYLRRALGYSLTGDMREQCWFLCHGAGANGKSKLLDTLEAVWGDYGVRASMSIFATVGHDTDKFNLADMEGKRLAFAAEVKPGSKLNSDVIKSFTGGETVRVERKYGHPFTLRPVGKVWLGVNHLPKANDDSLGFWRRVRQIPFLHTFEGAADDKDLGAKLIAEAPGILAWVVQGCLAWQEQGLTPPPEVIAATTAYETDMDPAAEFFAQYLRPEPGAVVSFAAIRARYDKYAANEGVSERDRLSNKGLAAKLGRRGYEKYVVMGVSRYRGLTLVDPPKDLLD